MRRIGSSFKSTLESSYFLFSLLTREPIRNFTQKHVPFVFLALLISTCYECIITGSLIALAKPYRYKDVANFINSSKHVVGFTRNLVLPEDIDKHHPTFVNVLKSHSVPPNRINDSFHIVTTFRYIFDEDFLQWGNLSWVGYLDKRVTPTIPLRMKKLQHYADMIYGSKGDSENYICDKFAFGSRTISWAIFGFALARRATQLHVNLLEFGITRHFDDVLLNFAELELPNQIRESRKGSDEEETFISLKHLKQFIVLNGVALVVWVGVFMVEWRKTVVISASVVFTRVKMITCRAVRSRVMPSKTGVSDFVKSVKNRVSV